MVRGVLGSQKFVFLFDYLDFICRFCFDFASDFAEIVVSISVESDSGSTNEKISVPAHPSVFLVQLLFDLSDELNRIGGFSLERVFLSFILYII